MFACVSGFNTLLYPRWRYVARVGFNMLLDPRWPYVVRVGFNTLFDPRWHYFVRICFGFQTNCSTQGGIILFAYVLGFNPTARPKVALFCSHMFWVSTQLLDPRWHYVVRAGFNFNTLLDQGGVMLFACYPGFNTLLYHLPHVLHSLMANFCDFVVVIFFFFLFI